MEHVMNASMMLLAIAALATFGIAVLIAALEGACEATVAMPGVELSYVSQGRVWVDCEAYELELDHTARVAALFDALCVDFDDEMLPAQGAW